MGHGALGAARRTFSVTGETASNDLELGNNRLEFSSAGIKKMVLIERWREDAGWRRG